MATIVHLHDPTYCDPFKAPIKRIQMRLTKVFGYQEAVAEWLAPRIRSLHQGLHAPFLKYWHSRDLDQKFAVAGISLAFLMERYEGDFVHAFLLFDAMHKTPSENARRMKLLLSDRRQYRDTEAALVTYKSSPKCQIPEW